LLDPTSEDSGDDDSSDDNSKDDDRDDDMLATNPPVLSSSRGKQLPRPIVGIIRGKQLAVPLAPTGVVPGSSSCLPGKKYVKSAGKQLALQ